MAMAETKKKEVAKANETTPKLYLVIRIRGKPGMKEKIWDTLKMLRMHKTNHSVLIWGEKSAMGMLYKVKDYVAFGEIDEKTLVSLLKKRGKIEGNKPLTDDHIKNVTQNKYKDINDLVKALLKGDIKYRERDIYKIKPVFRMHPPRKGHRGSIKKTYKESGTLGYVGNYINDLAYKMM